MKRQEKFHLFLAAYPGEKKLTGILPQRPFTYSLNLKNKKETPKFNFS